MTVISVIVGSTRQGRFSEKPAEWILQHLKKRSGVDARLLDLRDFPMPFFDQPVTPATPARLVSVSGGRHLVGAPRRTVAGRRSRERRLSASPTLWQAGAKGHLKPVLLDNILANLTTYGP